MINIIKRNKTIVMMFNSPIRTKLKRLPVAEGIEAIIDTAIISDNPFPMPLFVICSPSHITKKVPAVKVAMVITKKVKPGL